MFRLTSLALLLVSACAGATPARPKQLSPDTSPLAEPVEREASSGEAGSGEAVHYVGRDLPSGVGARLQAISVVDSQGLWASGVEGTLLRSLDGGESWQKLTVPDASDLQFRDLHAFDAERAFVLSAGPGELSRIYATVDGGHSWQLQFQNREADGFLDCFDFWNPKQGLAYGDSVGGELFVLRTDDGGQNWQRVAGSSLPPAGPGEGGFAASGGCVHTQPGGEVWIGTGAGGNARVLYSSDWGKSFSYFATPMPKDKAGGIMAVIHADSTLLLFGGDLDRQGSGSAAVARATDAQTFELTGAPDLEGAIYGAAASGNRVVAVGPKGAALSVDRAHSWSALDPGAFWSVAFAGPERFWMVGPEGRIKRFDAMAESSTRR